MNILNGETPHNPESQFIIDQQVTHANQAFDVLAPQFLGDDEARVWSERFTIVMVNDNPKGEPIPTVRYDTRTDSLSVRIEPESVLSYAEEITAEQEDSMEPADIVRFLIGAGVARAILAKRALPLQGTDQVDPLRRQIQEALCDRTQLWEAADIYDDEEGTNLRCRVEKLNDEQITRINTLRFAFGASLTYLSDTLDLQIHMTDQFREKLVEIEEGRALDLRTALALLDSETAYRVYDDAAPEILYALSFPMTPSEELQSFVATT